MFKATFNWEIFISFVIAFSQLSHGVQALVLQSQNNWGEKWPNGMIKYQLHFSPTSKQNQSFILAFEEFHTKTCLKFQEAFDAENFLIVEIDNLICASAQPCNVKGAQLVQFGEECLTKSDIVHELLHALCFSHEYLRHDRDNYLSFNSCSTVPDDTHIVYGKSTYFESGLYDYASQAHRQCACGNSGISTTAHWKLCGMDIHSGLSVMDADILNERFDCQKCHKHRWRMLKEITLLDLKSMPSFGHTDHLGRPIYPCRAQVAGEVTIGMYTHETKTCKIPSRFNNITIEVSDLAQVLVIPDIVSTRAQDDKSVQYQLETVSTDYNQSFLSFAVAAGNGFSLDEQVFASSYIAFGSLTNEISDFESHITLIGTVWVWPNQSYIDAVFPTPTGEIIHATKFQVLTCKIFPNVEPILLSETNVGIPTNDNRFDATIIASVTTALVASGIVIALVLIRRYKRKLEETNSAINADLNIGFSEAGILILNSFEFVKQHSTIIGSGNFGTVYKSYMARLDTHVAVKTVRDGSLLSNEEKAIATRTLVAEMKIMSEVGNHKNILRLLAVCNELETLFIVTEYCENGSLLNYLRAQKATNSIPLKYELLQFCMEISNGMTHLVDKNIIHGDLSARNVLLDEDRVCKISDFGLSRKLEQYEKYKKKGQEPLPWRWMAIESLERLEFSFKSDVWSIGVTFWEVFTLGKHPFPEMTWDGSFCEKLAEGLRLPKPELANDEIYSMMHSCWKSNPEDRPSSFEISETLKRLREIEYDTLYAKL